MSVEPQPLYHEDLYAFADGRLPVERIAAVKAWLERDSLAREQVASWQRQNELIGRLYGGSAADPLPLRLRPELMRRGRRRMLKRMAAGIAVGIVAGGGLGWLARGTVIGGSNEALSIAQKAAKAYWESAEASSFEVDGRGTAILSDWFEQRLGHAVPIPDLRDAGLQMLGGSALEDGRGSQAALLVYEDLDQLRFTLYVSWDNEPEPSEFRYFRTDDVNGFYWPHEELRCVLTADTDPDRLLEIARLAYDQMELEEVASRLTIGR